MEQGSPDTNPHIYGKLTYCKGAKNIQNNGERRVSSINGAEKVNTAICKRMKFDHTWYLIPYTKLDSKWIKDVRSETLKHLEKIVGDKLLNTGYSDDFFGSDSKIKGNKSKNKCEITSN